MLVSKFEILREILEENALNFTDTKHILDLVPFLMAEERSKNKRRNPR